jgi:hypothetical protein
VIGSRYDRQLECAKFFSMVRLSHTTHFWRSLGDDSERVEVAESVDLRCWAYGVVGGEGKNEEFRGFGVGIHMLCPWGGSNLCLCLELHGGQPLSGIVF